MKDKINHVSLRLDDLRYDQLKELSNSFGLSYNSMIKMLISQTYSGMKKGESIIQNIVESHAKEFIQNQKQD